MSGFSTILLALLLSLSIQLASARSEAIAAPEAKTGSEILWSIQKLNTLGRVLYVAAHPDDENTNLISYFSLGAKFDTAYLSMTRGDGGQNLIGSELTDSLGLIRTQELLAARRIDGGRQFFTRAKDFGYSKNPEETFRMWGREEILADTVWVIRKFRPDVIVTRFNPEPGYTHGHHTASTLLALEAFEAAADPQRFSDQLEWVDVWRARRVVWNTSSWFFNRSGQSFNEDDYMKLEVGGYEPLLGRSFNEVASASRSMHRSQGFGTRVERGSRMEYFERLAGESMERGLFDGVDTSWGRVPESESVSVKIARLVDTFDVARPAESISDLIELKHAMAGLEPGDWVDAKRAEVDGIIAACLGLHIRVLADKPYVLEGESLQVTVEAINRSDAKVVLESVELSDVGLAEKLERELPNNELVEQAITVVLPDDLPLPQPYWLVEEGTVGRFKVSDQTLIGKAENERVFPFMVTLSVAGEELKILLPLENRKVDPAKGEGIQAVSNLPLASVSIDAPVTLFPNHEKRAISVSVTSSFRAISGSLSLELERGWHSEPASHEVKELASGQSRSFTFTVKPPAGSNVVPITAVLDTGDEEIRVDMKRIRYEHIPEQLVFSKSATRAVNLEVAKAGKRVAYLAGAGDSVSASIQEIGYEVTQLEPSQVSQASLGHFDTVVIGIRGYNTIDSIDRLMPMLLDFVKNGGTVIAQYNTAHRLKTEQLGPYPLELSRDRVTDETAEMRMLAPKHPVLNTPNKITSVDFEGWVQERGLYFPEAWDPAYTAILSTNDPGEPPRDGSLLVAPYGDGHFVYTGLSFFRQLPAGVPGAYRIFANLLSLGHE